MLTRWGADDAAPSGRPGTFYFIRGGDSHPEKKLAEAGITRGRPLGITSENISAEHVR